MSSPVRLAIQKLFWLRMKLSKKLLVIAPRHDIYRGFKFVELGGLCFLWIICKQFLCRHCWATRAVCTHPHASRWICCSVWKESVAVFNKLWNSWIHFA